MCVPSVSWRVSVWYFCSIISMSWYAVWLLIFPDIRRSYSLYNEMKSCASCSVVFFSIDSVTFGVSKGSVINIKYVLLFSRRDGRGLPKSVIFDTTFE